VNGSDARLKEGIVDVDYGLSELLQLRPVSWTWKERPDDGRQFAQMKQAKDPSPLSSFPADFRLPQ
jgi:endosialidase-like protein